MTETKNCAFCGKELVGSKYPQKRVYCNDACNQNARYHRRTIQKVCEGCGCGFATKEPRIRYCSRICARSTRPKRARELIICDDHALVPLGNGVFAQIDIPDVGIVAGRNWHLNRDYAVAFHSVGERDKKKRGTTVFMHRLIMGVAGEDYKNQQVDHIDANGLNNRRSNLRICTPTENVRGRRKLRANRAASQYKGASRWSGGWKATIRKNGKHKHLGCFDNELDAARAYDTAAIEYFGEYARLNFPQ